jgi:enoyl-CoA hydratase/carnithine racemase
LSEFEEKDTSDPSLGTVTTTTSGHIFNIHIARPEKRNAFTPSMFAAMEAAYAELDANDDLWVGLVTFEGAHTTAGLDLPMFFGSMQSGNSARDPDRLDVFALNRRVSKPIVMAVQGITFTIGLEMMLAADIVVAADDCRFCQMEPKRGLGVFAGGNFRQIERAGWGNAMYHLLRADGFGAERALALGYVQEVHAPGEHLTAARRIADEIAANAPIAVQYIKKASVAYLLHGEQAAIDMIPEMRQATSSSEDAKEGMASFMEKRPPVFRGR